MTTTTVEGLSASLVDGDLVKIKSESLGLCSQGPWLSAGVWYLRICPFGYSGPSHYRPPRSWSEDPVTDDLTVHVSPDRDDVIVASRTRKPVPVFEWGSTGSLGSYFKIQAV